MTEPTRANAALLPGLTVCAACRSRDAVLVDEPGERWARPLCFECAEAELELASVPVGMVGLLKSAREEWRYRPLPAPRQDWETADHSRLNALRASWLVFEAARREVDRCWACLPSGSRCVREAFSEGVCSTHFVQGCTVPGLGWSGDDPRGRMVVRRGRSAA